MAKRTLEIIECDICGDEGERYVVQYPEGAYSLDRCTDHATEILALRETVGTWIHRATRTRFKISTQEDIEAQKRPWS